LSNLRFVLSVTNDDNDYQIEQAASAQAAARMLRVSVDIVNANNDAIEQSQQILKAIQTSTADNRPAAILVEPLGTALPQAACAAMHLCANEAPLSDSQKRLLDRAIHKTPNCPEL